MRRIVWLASYPKSGNTWLRAFLVNYLDNTSQAANINDLRMPIAASIPLFNSFSGIEAAELTHDEVDQLRPEVYAKYADSEIGLEANDLKFFKTHDAYTSLSDGRPLFPTAVTRGIIYIIRNPLDIAVSLSHFISKPIDEAISVIFGSKNITISNNFFHHF